MIKEIMDQNIDPKITLKNLSEKTGQEVFDYIANHLLAQNSRSIDPKTKVCLYRGPEGKKCAAGVLFDDSEYNPDYEGVVWIALHIDKKFTSKHSALIQELQNMHDNTPAANWAFDLKQIAYKYNLNFINIGIKK